MKLIQNKDYLVTVIHEDETFKVKIDRPMTYINSYVVSDGTTTRSIHLFLFPGEEGKRFGQTFKFIKEAYDEVISTKIINFFSTNAVPNILTEETNFYITSQENRIQGYDPLNELISILNQEINNETN